jgi:hypothetical protein
VCFTLIAAQHGVASLGRLDHRAGKGRLLGLDFVVACVVLPCFFDDDRSGQDVEVAGGEHLAARLPIGVAGYQIDVAFDAAKGAGGGGDGFGLQVGREFLAADGEADAATAEDAAFLALPVVRFGMGFARGFDDEVLSGEGGEIVLGDDVAAGEGEVVPGAGGKDRLRQ